MRCQRISPSSNLKCNGKMRLDEEDLPQKTYICFTCTNTVYTWKNKNTKSARRQWVSIRYTGKTADLKKRILYVKLTRRKTSDRSTLRPSVSATCPYLRCRWPLTELQAPDRYGYELKCRNNHRVYLRMDKDPAAWI
jgi:hypothetical protein